MSNAPSTLDAPSPTSSPDESATDPLDLVRSTSEALRNRFEFASFWSAVLLPLGYVPMLFGGLEDGRGIAFAALLALHAVALVAGHGYRGE